MKVCIYEWALHTFGGGQKVACKIAEYLSKKHQVTLLCLLPVDKKQLEKTFDVDLSKVKIKWLYTSNKKYASFLHLLTFNKFSKESGNYDIFMNNEAHETVKPRAKRNIMICHFPELAWYRKPKNIVDGFLLLGHGLIKTVLKKYPKDYGVYCTSEHCKEWLKKHWHVGSKKIVLFSDIKVKKQKKENILLSVGRLTKDKNHEFMINCFRKIYDLGSKRYKYVIAGTALEDQDYLRKLRKISEGYPIEIKRDLPKNKLSSLYNKSKIFFHAKGYGVNEEKKAQDLEHFGLVTVEAMSCGSVPITINKGGQKEIVEHGKDGFLYNDWREAVNSLKELMLNEKLRNKMSKEAVKKAKNFSVKRFYNQIDRIIK
jgi:glycosyltransferase involved in cell wall biosynthesis